MDVGISRLVPIIVNGKIAAHPFVHKMLLAVVPYHLRVLFFGHFNGQRHHDAPGKLGVPGSFFLFRRVPKDASILVCGRRMGGEHDFCVQHAFLSLVSFPGLIVLRENVGAALVGSPGNSGFSLGSFHNGDLEMGTGQFGITFFRVRFFLMEIAAQRRKGPEPLENENRNGWPGGSCFRAFAELAPRPNRKSPGGRNFTGTVYNCAYRIFVPGCPGRFLRDPVRPTTHPGFTSAQRRSEAAPSPDRR